MASKFKERGYSESVVNRGLSIASKIPRDKLLEEKSIIKKKNAENSGRGGTFGSPTFSTPYSLEYGKIRKIVKKYLPVLSHDPCLLANFGRGDTHCVKKSSLSGKFVITKPFLE